MKRLVSVMVSRAAHPTRNQPRAAQRARPAARPAPAPRDRCASRRPPRTRTPRPRAAPFSPQTCRGVPSRRRRGEASRGFRGPDDAWRSLPARCASPRASPAAGRAVQSPARLSHRRISGEEACVVCHSLCSNPRVHAPAASTSRPPAPASAPSLPARRAPSSSPLRPPLCTPLCTPPRSLPEARGRFERESFVY